MALFQPRIIQERLADLNKTKVEAAFALLKKQFSHSVQSRFIGSSEISLQGEFIEMLFDIVLGYTRFPKDDWNIKREQSSESSNEKADAAIALKSDEQQIIGVVELKSTNTTDLQRVEEQAFKYFNQHQPLCRYAITSNYQMLRLYVDDNMGYEEFDIFEMVNQNKLERFKLMYLYLNSKYVIEGLPAKLREETIQYERKITDTLYNLYKDFRIRLHTDLQNNNRKANKFVLFKKTQKLIDRFLFVLFAEDKELLPAKTTENCIKEWQKHKKGSLLDAFKVLFNKLYTGSKSDNIFAYNGGFFEPDPILDAFTLDIGNTLEVYLPMLQGYDFKTEVDVNILGHIFEHSLNDMDEMKALSEGAQLDKSKTKRKKEGVFYTPEYITRYIVDNSIGALCREKEREMQLGEGSKITKPLLAKYREWLFSVTVIDPACGSGAFLNQALNFFVGEHKRIDERMADVDNKPIIYGDYGDQILKNNIFGIDLNEEAVEIARLSLWLRTAKQGAKLCNLNDNIKVGNSLVDDKTVSDNAFVWKNEFPAIFKKGGFDVVIGNPPYVKGVFTELDKSFFKKEFKTAQYQLDLYILFMEKGVSILKKGGMIGFITPNSWLKNMMMSDCRLFLLQNTSLKQISPNLPKVFIDASVDSLVFVAQKSQDKNNNVQILEIDNERFVEKHSIKQDDFLKNDKYVFAVEVSKDFGVILKKMNTDSVPLSLYFEITRGINPYDIYRGQLKETIESKAYHADFKKDKTFVPELRGKHVNRYVYDWDEKHYISYGSWLAAPRDPKYFTGERIIFREILGKNFECTFIDESFKIDRSLYIAKPSDESKSVLKTKYVLALLASKLLALCFRYSSNEFDDLFPKIRLAEFKNLPLKNIPIKQQTPFIEKVDAMLTNSKELLKLKDNFTKHLLKRFPKIEVKRTIEAWHESTWKVFEKEIEKQKFVLLPKEKTEWQSFFEREQTKVQAIQHILKITDAQIDAMVYVLYGLTKEEIKIIEK